MSVPRTLSARLIFTNHGSAPAALSGRRGWPTPHSAALPENL